MTGILLNVDLDANDGALRTALFERGWLAPEEARRVLTELAETREALGQVEISGETDRLLGYALKTIKRQSETIERLLATIS